MKKIATLVGSAALLAAAFVPAIAATNECVNSTTGPFSNNTCTIKNTDVITVNNVNDAQIKNYVTSNSNTGYNEASLNTLGGTIKTGDATNNTTVSSVANINTTNITSALGAASNRGENSITGPYSNNSAWIENEQRINLYNSNTATVKNNVDADSNTGYNKANTNTGPASVDTGDAWLGLLVNTHVNDNYNDIRGSAGGTGTNVAENLTTGPFSNNDVAIYNRFLANVTNVNDLQVKNYVDAGANTGYNEAKTNTLGGDIFTGDAAAGVGVNTEGNINTTRIAMALGGFNNYGSNSVTGPDGSGKDPSVWIENTREVTVDNWNNKCESHNADRIDKPLWSRWFGRDGGSDNLSEDHEGECNPDNLGVLNNVDSYSDTGYNLSNTNTGGGSVEAGFAELLQQVLVHMNDTLTEILP
ncbi:MAG: hypothetical protein UV73_C0001G0213 [Candidatus Gottesmanbacteria bacterium GW2011_GWA2_43_14]|uniref:Uncharacterized protein n=1 Tax=Candidatus Gottesmanbacteria bacterium GW2011_GWA2_43_14 TaxID=1618443 RepID=A0A0G1DMC0_9BACT|nr:MAG: hypothetical protein UV73_C0001G0213 [Candidatus Gottesmanbacteria bacterium GW2011_GWA2_43_14]